MTHGIFQRTGTSNPKTGMESQKTQDCHSHPEEEEQSRRHAGPSLRQHCGARGVSTACVAVVAQSLSRVRLCDPMACSTPGFLSSTASQSLLKFTSTDSVMPSNHLILCHPLLLLPSKHCGTDTETDTQINGLQ